MGWGPDDGAAWPGRGMSVAELDTDTPPTQLREGLTAPSRVKWSLWAHRCGWGHRYMAGGLRRGWSGFIRSLRALRVVLICKAI